MRPRFNDQLEFDLIPSNLKVTNDYYATLERISQALDDNPQIVELAHRDLTRGDKKRKGNQGREHTYSGDTVLRIIICQVYLDLSLRETVIRIDDSRYLRIFVRIYNGEMMDYSTLDKLRNRIRPTTWKKINRALSEHAVAEGSIDGERLRMDTTACETDIHWPTDSSLLWDTYRVLARLIRSAREIDPEAVGDRRLLEKKAKRLMIWIGRKAGKKKGLTRSIKERYKALIELVQGILLWSGDVVSALLLGLENHEYDLMGEIFAQQLVHTFEHYRALGDRVVDQAVRRVLMEEQVPNDDKLFSIFEPHTELLIRGKAGKPVEFGHMVLLEQEGSKFVTGYQVFSKRPNENQLVDPALENHRDLFGEYPKELSADKGFYESMDQIRRLEELVEVVSIGKKGGKTEQEAEREASDAFKAGQRFRAGVEGSISVLKRVFGLGRIRNKGFKHFVATVGAAVFVHNLVILSRAFM